MITPAVCLCEDEGINRLAKLIYGEPAPVAPAKPLIESMCTACFGTGKTQEQDRAGRYTPYVMRCLCCGGSGRVMRAMP